MINEKIVRRVPQPDHFDMCAILAEGLDLLATDIRTTPQERHVDELAARIEATRTLPPAQSAPVSLLLEYLSQDLFLSGERERFAIESIASYLQTHPHTSHLVHIGGIKHSLQLVEGFADRGIDAIWYPL